jgi:hypothetical protein
MVSSQVVIPTRWRMRLADFRGRGPYAAYANEHQCIFIHIPKTAGSSIAAALFGVNSSHIRCRTYLDASPRKFREFFKFAFVRNPWDRVVSTYAFLKRGGMNEVDRAWAEEHVAPFPTFDEFVRRKLMEPNVLSWVHFRPQSWFICDDDNRLLVDFLGRYERLETDFKTVAARLGRAVDLPVTNASAHSHFSGYYTPETREIVARAYADDVQTFGYAFDAQ